MELADLLRAGREVERFVKAGVDLLVPGRLPFVGVQAAPHRRRFARGEASADQSVGLTVIETQKGEMELELVAAGEKSASRLELVAEDATEIELAWEPGVEQLRANATIALRHTDTLLLFLPDLLAELE